MFKNYFKIAWRNLVRNKVYSAINIMGLSLGLACAMLIILYVKDEVSYDRFHANVSHIYRVVNQQFNENGVKERKDGNSGYFQGPRFTAGVPEIKSFVRVQSGFEDYKDGTDIKSQELLYVDSNFFSVFSFPLIKGSPKTALLEPYSVVLSEDMARRHFHTADALGKTILFKRNDKFESYTVTGVAKKCPQNSSIKFEVLLPIRVSKEDEQLTGNWFNFFLNTFVVLSPNADIKAVERKMTNTFKVEASESIKTMREKYGVKGSMTYLLQPFTDMHLNKELPAQNGLVDGSNPMYSYILSGIAFFILLIACINFVNLTVARSIKRAKEIGIRKVVGGVNELSAEPATQE